MDFSTGDVGGSGDEDTQNSMEKKSPYSRLNVAQTTILENFFKECPIPDKDRQRQLADKVGLEPKQIKFWFQNKRTQTKVQRKRENNTTLRVEKDRMLNENLQMKEAIENIICQDCGGPPLLEEEHESFMRQMQLQNTMIKEKHGKVCNLLARYLEKYMSTPRLQQVPIPITESSSHEPALNGSSSTSLDQSLGFHNPMEIFIMEKALMSEIATSAKEELVKLLRINEPFWVNSSAPDGKLTLHRETYEKIFPQTNHMKGENVHLESSKDSGVMNIRSKELVDIFLDALTWVEHVEVDDEIHTHQLYRDLVGVNIDYGARRWILELQRMCGRFASFHVKKIPYQDFGGVIDSLEGRKGVMKFSHQMVKTFCESLTMSSHEPDFPHLTVGNNNGVRVNVRKSMGIGQPNGTVVMAATSFWLPLHYEKVFEFLIDHKRRAQVFTS
ncbi:START domain [Sesbania bispinosa]|nr:START domain [Sesbania bispinosa]